MLSLLRVLAEALLRSIERRRLSNQLVPSIDAVKLSLNGASVVVYGLDPDAVVVWDGARYVDITNLPWRDHA